ncbi:SSU ribosomal protein S6P modification protein [Virgibacillus subterraneus]|uniref:SSU ribosomal protein S6P modification protein n=1 Tax=Virgibacillus subterraneus TaxID=621109 RepID=A0A1H9DM57_9BACI|nr:RimK family alpha-L-glutamate ligase [Virgibacillus subterraneus]SEQ14397.1 SSU ribosomal protein S6P modification protein [Virgibacillus subterraneus]
MNLHGWIIYNGYLPGNKFLDFAEWIQDAALKQNIYTDIYKNNELFTFLSTDSLDLISENKESLPDFVMFTDKDIYLAKQLELMGIRVFNSAVSIEKSDDKIATYQTLAANHLPIPKTIVAPKAFVKSELFNPKDFRDSINSLGFPLILKEAFGSFGEQVYLVHSMEEALEKLFELHGIPFMLQEFISSSHGKDIRLQVVGDEVVAAMTRHASNDFRANITAGGTMNKYQPSREEKATAVAATKAIGADFAGVDLLFGPDNKPIICEINSNAHIRNMFDCTGINVAEYMIDYIKDTLKIEDTK